MINFLATLAALTGVTKGSATRSRKCEPRSASVLLKVAKWIVGKAKLGDQQGRGGCQGCGRRSLVMVEREETFQPEPEKHTHSISRERGRQRRLMMASNGTEIDAYLKQQHERFTALSMTSQPQWAKFAQTQLGRISEAQRIIAILRESLEPKRSRPTP